MREFNVVHVRCEKGKRVSDIVDLINNGPVFHRVFFEINNVNGPKLSSHSTLSDFFHIVQEEIAGGAVREVGMISNLDGNWINENPNNTASPSPQQLNELIRFANRAGTSSCSSVMIGFDEVEWKEGDIVYGTYGFEKARYYGIRGFYYLSNCIVINKDSLSSRLTCYVTCEAQYRNTPTFQKMLELLGKVTKEATVYAPSSEAERPEWERRYNKAQNDFNSVLSGLQELYNSLPYPMSGKSLWPDEERALPTLNTKKIAHNILKSGGWTKTNTIYNCGICYKKSMGDGDVIVLVDSTHRGHMLQINLVYCSEYFVFIDGHYCARFYLEPLTEEDSENYFRNLLYVLGHIEEQLNANR